MSDVPHIADAEDEFKVMAVTPDFCKVGKIVVPFFPVREIKPQKAAYTKSVYARSEKILLIDSIISGTKGNAGRGVKSGVSRNEGHVKVIEGADTVFIEGRKTARHHDQCWMNCQVDSASAREEDIKEVRS